VLAFEARRGKGAARQAGAAAARARLARWVITIDGDGQHDPADIPLLQVAAAESPEAVIVGGRLANARVLPPGRLNACRVAGFFVNWITGTSIQDTQSGFRCYPERLFEEIQPGRGGFVLETEILVESALAGRLLVEVDIRAAGQPLRPSRFRPAADGCAVGAYLASRVVRHCLREARAAVREASRVFDRERRRGRHVEMAEAGARYPGAPHLYGVAIGTVAARHARARLIAWWRGPRLRRAAVGLAAITAAPALLAAALAQSVLTRFGADVVTPLVNCLYSQERLAAALVPAAPAEPASGPPLPRISPSVTANSPQ
jgi:hypothetical protein